MTQQDDFVTQLRAQHQADPVTFFQALLREFVMNRTDEQMAQAWTVRCEGARWYAEDALQCFQTILDHPPRDLVDMIQQHGWIILPDAKNAATQDADDLYQRWLNDTLDRFQTIFQNTHEQP